MELTPPRATTIIELPSIFRQPRVMIKSLIISLHRRQVQSVVMSCADIRATTQHNCIPSTSIGVCDILHTLRRRVPIVPIAGVELLSRMLLLQATRRALPSSRAKVQCVCVFIYIIVFGHLLFLVCNPCVDIKLLTLKKGNILVPQTT